MKNRKIIVTILILLVLFLSGYFIYANKNKDINKNNSNNIIKDGNLKITSSFYPIQIMTQNITDGAKDVDAENFKSKLIGCICNISITTTDLQKIEDTDVFIENGGGLETFSEKIKEAYPKIKIIDAGKNIKDYIKDEHEVNLHTWLSIENYISSVEEIANSLEEINPVNKEIYKKNKEEYINKLKELLEEEKKIDVKNKKGIALNESLAYLFKDLGMDIMFVGDVHDESGLSADELKTAIDLLNSLPENQRYIFIEDNDGTMQAELIQKETKAKIIKLNAAMHGPADDNDYYINAMKSNFDIIKNLYK